MTDPFPQLNRSAALKGILFLLLVLLLVTMGSSALPRILGIAKINGTLLFITRLLFWVTALLIWAYSLKIDKQPLLVWEEKKYGFSFYLLSVITLLLVIGAGMFFIQLILSLFHLAKQSDLYSTLTAIFKTNLPLLVFSCITAGVTEELIFRAFLLPRLEIIFKRPWPAIILSSLLFGLMHAKYGTIINITGPIFIGLVFAWHYWKYRNIKVLILFHFLWDSSLLLLSIKKH